MDFARVIGHATATVKHPSLNGRRLLIVQMVDARDKPEGDPVIAIDDLGSRTGDRVMLSSDSEHVRKMVGRDDTPLRWLVLGIEDEAEESRVKGQGSRAR